MISDFKNGEAIIVRLPLVEADVRKTVTKKNFLSAVFTDGTDTIEGKWWDYNIANVMPEKNKVYEVSAIVSEYQNKPQLNINRMTLSLDQDLTPFMKNIGVSRKDLEIAVAKALLQIEDQQLMSFTAFVYDRYADEIYLAPSASGVHHVGMGGNVVHSIEVFNIGSDIVKSYPAANISGDLVKAGALLHDIGKARVYKMTGPVIDYTEIGHLVDHIVEGVSMLRECARHYASRESITDPQFFHKINMLEHIIVSHHGVLEYGSPVVPKFIEAHIINRADGISATIDTLLTANTKAGDAEMTDKVWACNNRQHFTQLYVAGEFAGVDTGGY